MNWTDHYIGIPFVFDGRTREGCDCWGLVRLVYAEQLGIELPELTGTLTDHSVGALRRVHRAAALESQRWLPVGTPEVFDVVLLRRGKINTHVGIVCGRGSMLHIIEGIHSTVETYTGLIWKHKVAGFFRYAE